MTTITIGSEASDWDSPQPVETVVPRLVPETQLLGPYQESGFQSERYLVRRADGHVVMLPALLYEVIDRIDGTTALPDIAAEVSRRAGRRLSAENLNYLIESKLVPLGIASQPGDTPVTVERPEPLLSLTLRGILLPARVVRRLAAVFSLFFLPPVVALFVAALAAFDAYFFTHSGLNTSLVSVLSHPGSILAFFGLLVLGGIYHELGHASACRYGGATPGRIGFGIYLFIPAFFTDVTDAYRLPRRGRIRTDLGGIYFNIIFCAVTGWIWVDTKAPVLAFVALLTQVLALEQLLPVVRFDGYFLLSDLIGVPDLFGGVGPTLRYLTRRRSQGDSRLQTLRPRVRVAVICWVSVVVPVLLATMVYMLTRLPVFARGTWRSITIEWRATYHAIAGSHPAAAAVAVLSMVILTIPFLGIAMFLGRLGRRCLRRIVRRRPEAIPAGTGGS